MYENRKVIIEKEYPFLSNYYGDWHQLSFYFDPKSLAIAIYEYSEDIFGMVSSQDMAFNLAKFQYNIKTDSELRDFVERFTEVWLHEFYHLIGLTDEGIKRVKSLGFPVA